jgi:hypothetical protein
MGKNISHHGVVITIAATAHAAGDAVSLEHGLVVVAGVSRALIGMMEQANRRAASLHRYVEGFHDQVPIIDGTDAPSHDERENRSSTTARYAFPSSPRVFQNMSLTTYDFQGIM